MLKISGMNSAAHTFSDFRFSTFLCFLLVCNIAFYVTNLLLMNLCILFSDNLFLLFIMVFINLFLELFNDCLLLRFGKFLPLREYWKKLRSNSSYATKFKQVNEGVATSQVRTLLIIFLKCSITMSSDKTCSYVLKDSMSFFMLFSVNAS